MKVLMIAVGSRGDTEPFCSLARELASCDHTVDFFVQKDHTQLAPTLDGVNLHELPFSTLDFFTYASSPKKGQDDPNPRVKFIGVIVEVSRNLVLPCWEDVLKVASTTGSSVILTTALARQIGIAVSQKLDIPIGIAHLQPLLPTGAFPHYSETDECTKVLSDYFNKKSISANDTTTELELKSEYLESYWKLEEVQHNFFQEYLDPIYQSLGLEEITFDTLKQYLDGSHEAVMIINAFSFNLIPPCPDAEENVVNVGALADSYIPEEWKPPSSLLKFLEESKEAPICVGYGSMPFNNVKVVLEALQEVNKRAVLVGDALKFEELEDYDVSWAKENLFQIKSVPYAWLLPKCSIMLCHGGAGVLHATLRAGIPILISPLMGDQFLHAKLVKACKLGTGTGSLLHEVSRDDLVSGIREGFLECSTGAKKLGEQIRKTESGASTLVKLLENKHGGKK